LLLVLLDTVRDKYRICMEVDCTFFTVLLPCNATIFGSLEYLQDILRAVARRIC
jgi:hypothetical protein